MPFRPTFGAFFYDDISAASSWHTVPLTQVLTCVSNAGQLLSRYRILSVGMFNAFATDWALLAPILHALISNLGIVITCLGATSLFILHLLEINFPHSHKHSISTVPSPLMSAYNTTILSHDSILIHFSLNLNIIPISLAQ